MSTSLNIDFPRRIIYQLLIGSLSLPKVDLSHETCYYIFYAAAPIEIEGKPGRRVRATIAAARLLLSQDDRIPAPGRQVAHPAGTNDQGLCPHKKVIRLPAAEDIHASQLHCHHRQYPFNHSGRSKLWAILDLINEPVCLSDMLKLKVTEVALSHSQMVLATS